MTCDQVRDRFSDRIDGLLDGATEADVARHLATCPACQRDLARFEQTVAGLHALGDVRAPAGFVDRVLAQVPAEPWIRRALRAVFLPLPLKLPLEAAAVVLVGILTVLLYRGTPSLDRASDQPDVRNRAAAPPPSPASPPASFMKEAPPKATEPATIEGMRREAGPSPETPAPSGRAKTTDDRQRMDTATERDRDTGGTRSDEKRSGSPEAAVAGTPSTDASSRPTDPAPRPTEAAQRLADAPPRPDAASRPAAAAPPSPQAASEGARAAAPPESVERKISRDSPLRQEGSARSVPAPSPAAPASGGVAESAARPAELARPGGADVLLRGERVDAAKERAAQKSAVAEPQSRPQPPAFRSQATAPPQVGRMAALPPPLRGVLRVRDHTASERALRDLIGRLGATAIWDQPEAHVVTISTSKGLLPDLLAGLRELGDLRLEPAADELPDRVTLVLRLGS